MSKFRRILLPSATSGGSKRLRAGRMRRSALQRDTAEKETCRAAGVPPFEQIALLLQGGGALGAYQAGVYEALAEADLHPDWVAGISIGAINSAIIAGNPREARVAKLREFWELVSQSPFGLDGNLASLLPKGDVARALAQS